LESDFHKKFSSILESISLIQKEFKASNELILNKFESKKIKKKNKSMLEDLSEKILHLQNASQKYIGSSSSSSSPSSSSSSSSSSISSSSSSSSSKSSGNKKKMIIVIHTKNQKNHITKRKIKFLKVRRIRIKNIKKKSLFEKS